LRSVHNPILLAVDGAPRRTKTRAEELRSLLADEIVQGRLAPGTPLEELEIAKRFSVSRTPVREALHELAASGLIQLRAHQSAIVARPSLERLRGMFDVLAELESLCAGLSAVHMIARERRQLADIHAELSSAMRGGDHQRYHLKNEEFHELIYTGSHNEYLAELTLATRTRISPFSRAQFGSLGRLALSHDEHDRVVTAILRGDQPTAAAEMRAHIASVEIAYERFAEKV